MFSLNNWQQGKKWTNWSGRYIAYPNQYYAPRSIEQLCTIIQEHAAQQRTIRVTGAAHSFSPIAMPEHSALSLHHLRGLIDVDTANCTATFYAGTYLYEVGPLLAQHGLALSNMGDIQEQSLAGVIATGTHGTGVTLGSFSSMVQTWGFVNGLGEYVEHTRADDDLSKALHLSVGVLGVLVKVTLQVVPLYSLGYTSERKNLRHELATYKESIRQNRHVEWFYFPGSESIQVKRMNLSPLVAQSQWTRKKEYWKLQLLENNAFFVASELCRIKPSFSAAVSKISSNVISEATRTDISYTLFPTPRHVKFVETEYAIPLEHFEDCLEEIHDMFCAKTFDVHFPIECRTTAAEDGFLSPTQNKESAFIAFHMYKDMDEDHYFAWVHQLMTKYNGRAHWGKVNCYDELNMQQLYPNFGKFQAIRRQLDPHNVFLTPYLRKIFAV